MCTLADSYHEINTDANKAVKSSGYETNRYVTNEFTNL